MRYATRTAGNVIIALVFVLLGGAALELAARIVDRPRGEERDPRRLAAASKALVEKKVKNLVVAFDNKYTYDQLMNIFPLMQDHLRYKPWIQIGNADHSNPFSIVENGVRKTSTGDSCQRQSETAVEKKPKVIWFYGGSTTYGIGVPWWDAMPSKFVEEADRNGICVTAVNFGVPYHFSRQEAIYFVTRLMNEAAPDAVVFLDGLNEFGEPGAALRAEPFFTPTLDKLVPVGPDPTGRASVKAGAPSFWAGLLSNLHMLRWLGVSKDAPSLEAPGETYSNANPPASKALSSDEQLARAIVDRYLVTRNFLTKVCESYGIRCFQFLQPIAAVDYHPQDSEVLTQETRARPEPAGRYAAGYAAMREAFPPAARCGAAPKGLSAVDLSPLFKDYDGIPYVDNGHYAPRANALLAAAIFRCVLAEP